MAWQINTQGTDEIRFTKRGLLPDRGNNLKCCRKFFMGRRKPHLPPQSARPVAYVIFVTLLIRYWMKLDYRYIRWIWVLQKNGPQTAPVRKQPCQFVGGRGHSNHHDDPTHAAAKHKCAKHVIKCTNFAQRPLASFLTTFSQREQSLSIFFWN